MDRRQQPKNLPLLNKRILNPKHNIKDKLLRLQKVHPSPLKTKQKTHRILYLHHLHNKIHK